MQDLIIDVVRGLGVFGIAILTFLENVFPPIPSELIMPLAGYISSRGGMSFTGAVVAGTAGSLLGAIAWYLLGLHVGERRLEDWIRRHGRWLTLSVDDVNRAPELAWLYRIVKGYGKK